MATIFNPIVDKEKEEQEGQQQEPAVGQSTPLTSGSSSSISAPSATTASPQAANKPSRSGQFTNIQNILAANKQGSQQLGQNVSEKVNKQVQTGLGKVDKSKEASIGNIQNIAGEAGQKQTAGQQAIQEIFQGGKGVDVGAREGVAKQGLDTQYQQQLQGSQFQNLQNLYGTQQGLRDLSNQTKTSSGQQAILQQNFARPSYTKGQSNLDSLLLSGNKEGQQGLAKARQTASQFNPAFQKAQGEFEATRTQTQGQLDTSLEGLKQDIQRKISQGQDATAETSLFARLKQEADQFNAGQQTEASKVSDTDAVQALKNAGFNVNHLRESITIPGTNIQVKARDFFNANPGYFQETFQNADVGNINQDALTRLNALNRIGGAAELNSTQALNRDIQRGLTSSGTGAISAAQAALKSQGLDNLNAFNVARSNVTPDMLDSMVKDGLGNAAVRGNVNQMLQGLQGLPPDQLAKFLTNAGFGADAKSAPSILKNIIQDAEAYTWSQQPENKVTRTDVFGRPQVGVDPRNPYAREGQTLASYNNAINFSKQVAAAQQKYNQQQAAIQKIINKNLLGKK